MITLERPLIGLDFEGTHKKPYIARICQMAWLNVIWDGNAFRTETKVELINPTVPIPPNTTKVHGITDEMVKGAPTFADRAAVLHKGIQGCDLFGYNLRKYDVPVLYHEFERAGIEWDWRAHRIIDVFEIFRKKEPRDLGAAVAFYCGRDHAGAHDAGKDAEETWNVLERQLRCYADLSQMTVPQLDDFTKREDGALDLDQKIGRDEDGDYVYLFGEKEGTKVKDDVGLAQWMLTKDFSSDTREIVRGILKELGAPEYRPRWNQH